MQKKWISLGIGLTLGLVACDLPGLVCTQMACVGQLMITIEANDLVESEYTLSFESETLSETCAFSIPFDPSAVNCESITEIEVVDGLVIVNFPLRMGENFDTLDIALSESDFDILNEAVTVEWSDPWYPNGKACDGDFGCRSTQIDLALD